MPAASQDHHGNCPGMGGGSGSGGSGGSGSSGSSSAPSAPSDSGGPSTYGL
jgi:hypothetical protein